MTRRYRHHSPPVGVVLVMGAAAATAVVVALEIVEKHLPLHLALAAFSSLRWLISVRWLFNTWAVVKLKLSCISR